MVLLILQTTLLARNLEQSALTFPFQSWAKIQLYASAVGDLQVRLNGAIYYLTTVIGWNTLYHRSGADTNGLRIRANFTNDYTGSIDNVIVQELPASIDRKYYLDTDGVDDWMEVKPTLNLGEQWWHVGAWQSDGSGKRAFATSSDHRGAVRHGGGWAWYNSSSAQVDLTTLNAQDKQVLTIEQAGTNSISGRSNGANSAGVITPYDDSGDTQGLALFTQWNLRFAAGLDGRFYGGSWGQGQVDYDELTVLQDYLGTTTQPPIDPPDVTEYADVYELLAAQTGAVLFDINDKTSLRVGRDGSGGVPVDGDPVGMMLDVSDTGGATVAAATAARPELVTNGTFDTDTSGWTAAANGTLSWQSGVLRVTTGGGSGSANQALPVLSGTIFVLSFDLVAETQTAGTPNVSVTTGLYPSGLSSTGTHQFIVTAGIDNPTLTFATGGAAVNGEYIEIDNISVKEISSHAAIAPSDSARPTLASYNTPISSREVLTTTYGWNITDGGRA